MDESGIDEQSGKLLRALLFKDRSLSIFENSRVFFGHLIESVPGTSMENLVSRFNQSIQRMQFSEPLEIALRKTAVRQLEKTVLLKPLQRVKWITGFQRCMHLMTRHRFAEVEDATLSLTHALSWSDVNYVVVPERDPVASSSAFHPLDQLAFDIVNFRKGAELPRFRSPRIRLLCPSEECAVRWLSEMLCVPLLLDARPNAQRPIDALTDWNSQAEQALRQKIVYILENQFVQAGILNRGQCWMPNITSMTGRITQNFFYYKKPFESAGGMTTAVINVEPLISDDDACLPANPEWSERDDVNSVLIQEGVEHLISRLLALSEVEAASEVPKFVFDRSTYEPAKKRAGLEYRPVRGAPNEAPSN